jgi:hypothetical protein
MRLVTFGLIAALGFALSGGGARADDDDVTLDSLTTQGFEIKAAFAGEAKNQTVYILQKGANVFRCIGTPGPYAWSASQMTTCFPVK